MWNIRAFGIITGTFVPIGYIYKEIKKPLSSLQLGHRHMNGAQLMTCEGYHRRRVDCFVHNKNRIGSMWPSAALQEGSLPSDGSGIDPHATLPVVQPVTQTGRRRAEERREVVAVVFCQRVTYSTGPLCPVTSSRSRSLLAASSVRRLAVLHKWRRAAADLT